MNRFLARWLDETEESRFDVEHVPGRLIPAYPLTHSRFLGLLSSVSGPAAAAGPPCATAAAAFAGPGPAGAAGSGSGTAAGLFRVTLTTFVAESSAPGFVSPIATSRYSQT